VTSAQLRNGHRPPPPPPPDSEAAGAGLALAATTVEAAACSSAPQPLCLGRVSTPHVFDEQAHRARQRVYRHRPAIPAGHNLQDIRRRSPAELNIILSSKFVAETRVNK